MKIVSSGKAIHSPEFYKKKVKRRRIRLVLFASLVLIILATPVYFSRREGLLINDIRVEGNGAVRTEEIRENVEETISGHYLWLIPRANVLFYPRHAVEKRLLKSFPRLASADVEIVDSRTLSVAVFEREPKSLYCTSSDCFFLNDDGLIFDRAPTFSGNTYFIYTSSDTLPDPIGKHFLPTPEFKELKRFMESLSFLNLHPSAFEVLEDEYHLILPNSARVMWRRADEFSIIYSNLEAFLLDSKIKSQTNFLERIQYLDLRTDNKVFYKFR